jgi:hypothetical protein
MQMNSRTQINSRWLARLAEEYPESAGQLGALTDHLLAKQERLAALIRYCAARPELPMMRMYAEYGAALDAVALEPLQEVAELAEDDAAKLGPRERAARTKRIRTDNWVLDAALKFILQRSSWRMDELAKEAGVGVATVHTHFHSRSNVLVAAYERLLS